MAKAVSYKIERFTGMHHSLTGDTPRPDLLWFSENLVPVDGLLVTRPGIAAGGIVAAGVGQGLAQFVDGGTERLIAVVSGEIYDVSGTTWTRRVTTANLTTASITLSASARVYMTQLGEYLHFTDGTNIPFMWDGAAGAGGLTSLTASPVLYGAPTVYYGKLFGIKNTDRQMIVWSEENAMQTGYEAGGYTNRWALTQTGGGKLWALKGTNEALYYWRASNVGAINGEVGPNFTTTGVHDAVSLERGSQITDTLAAFNGVWFYDEQQRPAVIKNGQVVELWSQMTAAVGAYADVAQPYRATSSSTLGMATVAPAGSTRGIGSYPSLDAVIFWYVYPTGSSGLLGAVFHGTTHQLLCYFTVSGSVYGAQGSAVVTLESTGDHWILPLFTDPNVGRLPAASGLGRATTAVADRFGNPVNDGTNPTIRFVAGRMAETPAVNITFDTLRLEVERETTDVATIGVQRFTSIEQTNALLPAAQTFAPTIDTKETHLIGMTAYGRWIAPVVTINHTVITARSPVRFYRLEVDGFVDAPADAVS